MRQRLAGRRAAELSDGERQRVLVARALAQRPALLLLDEPTAFLDVTGRVALLGLLCRLAREEGLCVLVSTHDLEPALRLADRVWLVDRQGRLRSGPPEQLVVDGVVAEVFDAPGLEFDAAAGSFTLRGAGAGPAVTVAAPAPVAALVGRLLAREGCTVAEAGTGGIAPSVALPAPPDVFRVTADGTTVEVAGWARRVALSTPAGSTPSGSSRSETPTTSISRCGP